MWKYIVSLLHFLPFVYRMVSCDDKTNYCQTNNTSETMLLSLCLNTFLFYHNQLEHANLIDLYILFPLTLQMTYLYLLEFLLSSKVGAY